MNHRASLNLLELDLLHKRYLVMASQNEASLPDRSQGDQVGGAAPSKNALKKAAKEKEKAEKAAKRQQQEAEEQAKAAHDSAKDLYGHITYTSASSRIPFLESLHLIEGAEEKEVTVDAYIYNARVQSAKLAFLVLRDEGQTVQVVVAEGGAQGISRQMVKWCGGINSESFVQVSGFVKKPKEPVTSTTIPNSEIHVTSLYIKSEAAEKRPVQVKDTTKSPSLNEEEEGDAEGKDPNSSLKTRLDNRVLSMRAPATRAIFELQSEIKRLFYEYMYKANFTDIEPSYMVGAATEGGSGVFEINYFGRKAYLTQSPQFFKQMAIAGGMKAVFTKGPVFRAENSNTKRHLTEVSHSSICSPKAPTEDWSSSLASISRCGSTSTTTKSSPSVSAS